MLPAAITLMALLAMVGIRMRSRQHHADDAPRGALDEAHAVLVRPRVGPHGLRAQYVLERSRLLDLVIQAAREPVSSSSSLPNSCLRLSQRFRMIETIRPRSSRLNAATFFCASVDAFTASSTVSKRLLSLPARSPAGDDALLPFPPFMCACSRETTFLRDLGYHLFPG